MKRTKRMTAEELINRLEALSVSDKEKKQNKAYESEKQEIEYAKAFREVLHTGIPTNSVKRGSDGSGGFLVPDTYEKKIVECLEAENILRKLGTTIKTTNDMKIPVVIGHPEATWVQEGNGVPISDVTYGEIKLDAYKLVRKIVVSEEMLEDAAFDVEKYILQTSAKSIAKTEEEAFFNGDGNGKPIGLSYQAEIAGRFDTISDITIDDVIDLIHSLNTPYRKNAVFVMSEEMECRLRKLTIYRGNRTWEKALTKGFPDKFLGYPVYTTSALNLRGQEHTPLFFGDFRYFKIGDRGKRTVKRLVEKYADKGQVAYITSERVDAKLVLPEAIKSIQVAN